MIDFDDFVEAMRAEHQRALAKYPAPNTNLAALAGEAGEVATAMNKEPFANVQTEAVQTAVMCARLALEGDPFMDKYRTSAGLDPSEPKPEAVPMAELWDMPFGTAVTTPDYVWAKPPVLSPDAPPARPRGSGMTTNQLRYAVALVSLGLNVIYLSADIHARNDHARFAQGKIMPTRYFIHDYSQLTSKCVESGAMLTFAAISDDAKITTAGLKAVVVADHHVQNLMSASSLPYYLTAWVEAATSTAYLIGNQADHIEPPQ